MKKVNIAYVLILVIISLYSCTKQGPAGPAGQNGSSGTNGTNGINGNANVTKSGIVSYSPSQWAASGNANEYYVSLSGFNIPNPSTDLVQAYVRYPYNNTSIWYSLSASNISYVGDRVGFSFANNIIFFHYYFSQRPAHTMDFRVVLIPASRRIPNLNIDNYAEVAAAYNLKD
jgi:hypothetical protein